MPNESDIKREPVWPAADRSLRPLSDEEIERLQHRLGRPIDRDYLIYWLSQAIKDVVRLWGDPAQPTLRERRDGLSKIAKEGRRWIETVETSPGLSQLGRELDDVKRALARLCHRAELLAKEIRVKRGNPPTPAAVLTFIDWMIGIAKTAKVYPSSEGRALRSETAPRDPPDFFSFVDEALEIAADVIESSPLPEQQRYGALSAIAVPSRGALSKLIEQARGRSVITARASTAWSAGQRAIRTRMSPPEHRVLPSLASPIAPMRVRQVLLFAVIEPTNSPGWCR